MMICAWQMMDGQVVVYFPQQDVPKQTVQRVRHTLLDVLIKSLCIVICLWGYIEYAYMFPFMSLARLQMK